MAEFGRDIHEKQSKQTFLTWQGQKLTQVNLFT